MSVASHTDPRVMMLEDALRKGVVPDAGGLLSFGGGTGSTTLGHTVTRGTREVLKAYETSPFLRMVASRVSYSTASVEWVVLRKTHAPDPNGRGRARIASLVRARSSTQRVKRIASLVKEHVLEKIDDHPILDLLDSGNDIHSGHAVRKAWQLHYDLVGDGFLLVSLVGNKPTELLPIPPHWVRETPTPGRENVFIMRADGSGAKEFRVPGERIVWINDVSPFNPYGRGTGLTTTLGDELDTDEFVARTLKQHFINGARPDVVVTVEGVKAPELEIFKQSWLSRLQGYLKSGSPHFLNRKVDISTIEKQLDDVHLLRPMIRDIIMQVWGIPPEIFGVLSNSNRSTIDASQFLYATNTLLPRLEVQRMALQKTLLPLYGDENLVLDYVSPVEEDRDARRAVMASLPWAFKVDDIREAAALEPLEDDVGQVFVHSLGQASSELPAGGPDTDTGTDGGDDDLEGGDEEGKQYKATKDLITDAAINLILASIDARQLSQAVDPVMAEAVEQFAQELIARLGLGIEFRIDNPRVVDFLKRRALERLSTINRTTRKRVREILVIAQQEGRQLTSVANAIGDVFTASRGKRSLVIARTETVKASNFGVLEGMKQGGVEGKQWLSSRDDKVREAHQALEGVIVGLQELFTSPVTGAQAPHPGDFGVASDDIQCRCTMLAVVNDKTAKVSEQRLVRLWKAHEGRRAPLERVMRRGLRAAFSRQLSAVRTTMGDISR